ncbi:LacI family transcriptional regulator [Gracilibacillus halotolerans]|uniref:LacI family transcriptional regulator n=1 Tax=Gracilibacillus halotolerans TaxID=74386 RepID=A0A841REC0_9BACI|nr:LacI family DNA-binding transcriptional regulator [Gracilibacillus halotolerans]MBB6512360.1 LacI family transcriptional regulator [Gracilibacillus halotolerans]
MVTIRDVAKYANVSVATVSRVLNNKGQVSEETKRNVREAIEHLKYRPNLVARTLYKKTSSMIGLIVPDITNPFFPALARTVEDRARSYGYTVILCNTDGSTEKEADYISSLQQKGIDGIIISTNRSEADDFKDIDIPLVALDRIVNSEIPTVTAENKNGAIKATKHLIDVGCQKVVHIQGPRELATTNDRKDGFLEVVQEADIEHVVVEADFDIKVAEETAYQLLQEQTNIDGFFAGSDVIALGIIKAAHRLGLNIPEDLQIVGFDGIEMGKIFIPSLTTIEQPIYEMGALAVDLLSQQIEKKELDKHLYEFPINLVIGNTTKR